jgi:hypothetical protein
MSVMCVIFDTLTYMTHMIFSLKQFFDETHRHSKKEKT